MWADQICSAAATGLFWLARRVLPRGNFGAGLVELRSYVVSQFNLVFKIIVNPFADFFDFRARQLWNRGFDFFNRAHGDKEIRILAEDVLLSKLPIAR